MEYNLALAGDPVRHSLSPIMQSAALKEAALAGSYRLEECSEAGLRELVAMLRDGQLQGLNITMPYKALAADLADNLTPAAERSHSVNSMKMEGGRLWGHSTDAIAVREALDSSLFASDSPLFVLGSGGAAAAALSVTQRRTFLSSRNFSAARALAERFRRSDVGVVEFGAGVVGAIVLNATPLGMEGEPIPDGILEVASGLIDLPYGVKETPAVRVARLLELAVIDGYEFLAMQAAESFRWWTGIEADIGLMARAARNV